MALRAGRVVLTRRSQAQFLRDPTLPLQDSLPNRRTFPPSIPIIPDLPTCLTCTVWSAGGRGSDAIPDRRTRSNSFHFRVGSSRKRGERWDRREKTEGGLSLPADPCPGLPFGRALVPTVVELSSRSRIGRADSSSCPPSAILDRIVAHAPRPDRQSRDH